MEKRNGFLKYVELVFWSFSLLLHFLSILGWLCVCALLLILVVLENQNLLVASAVEVAQRKFKSSNFAYNLSTFLQASQNLKLIDCKFQFHKTTTNEISSNAHSKTAEIEKRELPSLIVSIPRDSQNCGWKAPEKVSFTSWQFIKWEIFQWFSNTVQRNKSCGVWYRVEIL